MKFQLITMTAKHVLIFVESLQFSVLALWHYKAKEVLLVLN